jgi:hypothetical protein
MYGRVLVLWWGNVIKKRLLGRPKRRRENNIKINI